MADSAETGRRIPRDYFIKAYTDKRLIPVGLPDNDGFIPFVVDPTSDLGPMVATHGGRRWAIHEPYACVMLQSEKRFEELRTEIHAENVLQYYVARGGGLSIKGTGDPAELLTDVFIPNRSEGGVPEVWYRIRPNRTNRTGVVEEFRGRYSDNGDLDVIEIRRISSNTQPEKSQIAEYRPQFGERKIWELTPVPDREFVDTYPPLLHSAVGLVRVAFSLFEGEEGKPLGGDFKLKRNYDEELVNAAIGAAMQGFVGLRQTPEAEMRYPSPQNLKAYLESRGLTLKK